ncbi:MAG TPA: peptidoglycan bridge formation glycyltransferase FemA/FemB family protein [Candidatus Limnocylindrales bacterium]|nr:peptidoglycan bridge formation glycyltransferase FemA/FemB family protein [Candidatus Limnocylindrales bacterium]
MTVEAWDEFVQANRFGTFMQLSAWAETKAINGWQALRLFDPTPERAIGAQVLVQRRPPLPWAYAYAPRGPVTEAWDARTIEAFTATVRRELPGAVGRVSHLRIDPEVELGGLEDRDGEVRAALRRAGWRPAPSVQANATRVIDLGTDEAALWGGMRKKWRQYCSKARTSGVTVVDAGEAELEAFYRIYRETADRAGFVIRTDAAYRDVWQAFSKLGAARLLFARSAEGEDLATLFLLRAGDRVIEPFGGMTEQGAGLRANYLLKWEAIRSSNEAGASVYDLWGLPNKGIAYFKEGFGGREVRYIGAWDLVLDPAGWLLYGPVRQAGRRLRRRLRGGRGSAAAGGADPAGGADA